MKKTLFIILTIIGLILFMQSYSPTPISNDSIRFRIVANSNDTADQAIKMNIKKDLEENLFTKVSKSTSIEETRKLIRENENLIRKILDKYEIDYNISYGNNYFPSKEYKGITYDSGTYESLVINLGESKGNNWWCVLYPPLCMLETDGDNYDDVEYKFYIEEIISKLTS